MAGDHDPDELERLLHGDDHPTVCDAGATHAARLLATMRGAPSASELTGEVPAVTAIAAAIERTAQPSAHRRSRMLPQFLSAKAAAIGLAAVLAGAGAAAASTGSLPSPAQSAVSSTLSHVGVSVPDPGAHPHAADHRSDTATTDSTEASDQAGQPRGPDATGPARVGLCRAWTAHTTNGHAPSDSSVAFRNLQQAATDAGQSVAGYCKDVEPPTHDTSNGARPDDTAGSPHTPSPTSHVATPNAGGIGTANGASDGHNDNGARHASDAATLGSDNAGAQSSGRH